MAIPTFVDQVTLHVYGGHGGNGCASIHREKFKPLGGPDGGNGGDGGSVILRVDHGLTTLVAYHRQAHWRATSGQPGRGDHQNGARGEDVVLSQDQVLGAVDLDLVARVLTEKNAVALLDRDRTNFALLVELTVTDGDHLALGRLFLRRVGDDDAAFRLVFFGNAAHEMLHPPFDFESPQIRAASSVLSR